MMLKYALWNCPYGWKQWRSHGAPVVLMCANPPELRVASIKADGFELLTSPWG